MTETKPVINEAKLVEIPAQFQPAIQLEDEQVITAMELQVLIYNKLLKLEKALVA